MNPEEIREMYMRGFTVPRAAELLNVTVVQVERAVKTLTQFQLNLRRENQRQLIRQGIREGLTQTQVAEQLGVTQAFVSLSLSNKR